MPDAETGLASKFRVLAGVLDERARRLVAAAEAEALGFGGVTAVARASGLSRGTVIRGIAELKVAPKPTRGQRIGKQGAGRKRTIDQDASLKRDLESLVEPVTRGEQNSIRCERPLRPNCCPREAGLDDRTTLLSAVGPLTARPAEVGRVRSFGCRKKTAVKRPLAGPRAREGVSCAWRLRTPIRVVPGCR